MPSPRPTYESLGLSFGCERYWDQHTSKACRNQKLAIYVYMGYFGLISLFVQFIVYRMCQQPSGDGDGDDDHHYGTEAAAAAEEEEAASDVQENDKVAAAAAAVAAATKVSFDILERAKREDRSSLARYMFTLLLVQVDYLATTYYIAASDFAT